MTTIDFAILLLFVLAHAFLSVVLHEAGHLVFGLLTGYRFGSFNILSFVWARQEGKLVFRRNKNAFIAGQCLMRPNEEFEKFRHGLYNAGGGLFNLIAAGACLPGMLLLPYATPLYLLCLAGVAVNAAMAIVNLVPMNLEIPNDGLNLLKASRSKLARRGLWLMLKVNDEVQQGKRYRDYGEEDFALEEGEEVNPKNYLECYVLMLQAARLEDMGEHQAALEVYDGLDLEKVSAYYANLIRADYLYYYTAYALDREKAEALFARKAMQKLLKNPIVTLMRIRAAYLYFVLAMPAPARELLEKARAALDDMPSLGLRAMEADALDELAEMMEAGEQNSLDGEGPQAAAETDALEDEAWDDDAEDEETEEDEEAD